MKNYIKIVFALWAMAFSILSCRSSDTDDLTENPSEIADFKKVTEVANETHIVELYSKTGTTKLGYNELAVRIKNKATNEYEKNVTANWMPLMHMTSMAHSCPKSALQKTGTGATLLSGYIVFQMPGNATEYWDLKIDYSIGANTYSVITPLNIAPETRKSVSVFTGTDNVKYVLAHIAPETPKVAINDWTVGVWKMQDMMNFPVVDGYTVHVDPRMPAMGNHGSPNNAAATQAGTGKLYNGKVSLTMTGYWKLNLRLANANGAILKGDEVTDAAPASSIFFELDF